MQEIIEATGLSIINETFNVKDYGSFFSFCNSRTDKSQNVILFEM